MNENTKHIRYIIFCASSKVNNYHKKEEENIFVFHHIPHNDRSTIHITFQFYLLYYIFDTFHNITITQFIINK